MVGHIHSRVCGRLHSAWSDHNPGLLLAGSILVRDASARVGGPKLVKIDLATNKVMQTIPLDEDVAPKRSYLNDVRLARGS